MIGLVRIDNENRVAIATRNVQDGSVAMATHNPSSSNRPNNCKKRGTNDNFNM
jgi:hypothetical protein